MNPQPTAAAHRGTLEISDGVVAKIAAQVVSEIGGAYGSSGGFLGLRSHADEAARPQVDVELSEASADVSVRVGLAYPASIRQTADRIRGAVATRVPELTGIDVHRVDIEVAFLSVADGSARHPGGGLR